MVDAIKSYTSTQNAYGNVVTQNNAQKPLKANLPDSSKIEQELSEAEKSRAALSEDAIISSISTTPVSEAEDQFTQQSENFEKKEELRRNSRGLA